MKTVKMKSFGWLGKLLAVGFLVCVLYYFLKKSTPGTAYFVKTVNTGKKEMIPLDRASVKAEQESKDTENHQKAAPILSENKTMLEARSIVKLAKQIRQPKRPVLVTFINDAHLTFAYSWLCNTKDFGIHNLVLIITTEKYSKDKFARDWPEVSVFYTDYNMSIGNQMYTRAGYINIQIRRTELILALIEGGIDLLVFEVDCLWLRNPVPEFEDNTHFDMMMNPVAERKELYAAGFYYLRASKRVQELWRELTYKMRRLGAKIKHFDRYHTIAESENDQVYMSQLIFHKYTDLKIKVLPLENYQDGKWYSFPEEKRNATRPFIINNNWVIGNLAKIQRAKKWGHWFLLDDGTCDKEQIRRTVNPSGSNSSVFGA